MDAFATAMELLGDIQASDERRSKRPLVPAREVEHFVRDVRINPGLMSHIPDQFRQLAPTFVAPDGSFLNSDGSSIQRPAGIPETQSLTDFVLLETVKQDCDRTILNSFLRNELFTSSTIYFGTSETLHINAVILPVPESDAFLVVINRGVWDAIRSLTQIAATALVYDQAFLSYQQQAQYIFSRGCGVNAKRDGSRRVFAWTLLSSTCCSSLVVGGATS